MMEVTKNNKCILVKPAIYPPPSCLTSTDVSGDTVDKQLSKWYFRDYRLEL